MLAGHGERGWLGTAATEAGVARWEPTGVREYYDYRRAIYGNITHKAILVDVAGTLLAPTSLWPRSAHVSSPIADSYFHVALFDAKVLIRPDPDPPIIVSQPHQLLCMERICVGSNCRRIWRRHAASS